MSTTGAAARRMLLAMAALAAIGAVARAQDEQAPPPTFRAEINYVQLPVRVIDGDGQFVSGLTRADFQVFEDGQPQAVTAFSAVDIPVFQPDATVPDAPVAAVDPVASNEASQVDGRVYVLVLDDRHTEPGDTQRVRRLVHDFVREQLSANDLTAVVFSGGARGQDFTRNRALLLEAVDRFNGDFDRRAGGQDSRLRAQQAIAAVSNMAEWMGSIRGRRKALVLVSPGAICDLGEAACSEALRYALRMAVQADVSIYAVDPRGLVATDASPADADALFTGGSEPSGRMPSSGARYLAEQSGGFAVMNTNALRAGLERIVRENSSYYLIGYYSGNTRADGKVRKNDVKVSRRDVQVVHRTGYAGPLESDAPASLPSISQQLRELLRIPLPVSAMALRVAAAPFLSAGGRSRVAVIVELPSETLKATEENGKYRLDIGLSVGLYDRDGTSVGGDDPRIELEVPLAAGPRITAQGIRIVSRITVPPGTYRLWVGATQMPSGVRGSVMTEIDVPAFDRYPLTLSGIAVTTSVAERMYTARTDEILDDVLGAPPVAHREFPADSDLWVYGEIYDHRSDGGDVVADVHVTAVDGRVVYDTPLEPAPVQFGYLARIPLTELGPGSYVATIEARSAQPTPVSATRAVRFRVK